jgi:hypothetical protein
VQFAKPQGMDLGKVKYSEIGVSSLLFLSFGLQGKETEELKRK